MCITITGTPMGDGPSSTKTIDTKTDPWAPQVPYLTGAFKAAQDAYNKNTAQGAYSGDYVAAPSQTQYDAYGNAVTQGYNAQGVNNGMLSSGTNNAATGAAGAGTAMGGLLAAGGDNTASNIASARAYADGLDIPGAVRASMYEANRNAAEGDIPNIYRAAAASGGVNSDRAALSQGVVERGLAEKSLGLGTQMYNSAYMSGLDNAQKDNAMGVGANSAAGGIAGGLLNAGLQGQNAGIDNQTGLNANITGGANGATELDQQTLNNLMQKYNGGQGYSWSQLQNLMSIVGKPFGSQTKGTETTQTEPSMMQNIGSGIGIAYALFCDRNIKHVYAQVSADGFHGFPTYLFSYRDDPVGQLHEGPMAQDVELTHPHAVVKISGVRAILIHRL